MRSAGEINKLGVMSSDNFIFFSYVLLQIQNFDLSVAQQEPDNT